MGPLRAGYLRPRRRRGLPRGLAAPQVPARSPRSGKLASDRLSNLLPKPVWAMLGLGYLYSFVAGIAANPTIFALTMLAFV